MSYDFDINNYSVDELFSFIKINKTNKMIKHEEVINKINDITKPLNKNNPIEKKVLIFMNQIMSKMNNYFEELTIKDSYSELNSIDPLNNINLNNGHKTYNTTQYDAKNITSGGDHFIIKNKKTPVNYTYDYKFPIGDVNPVERRLITKTICFNTLFRPNFMNTYFVHTSTLVQTRTSTQASTHTHTCTLTSIHPAMHSNKQTNRHFY